MGDILARASKGAGKGAEFRLSGGQGTWRAVLSFDMNGIGSALVEAITAELARQGYADFRVIRFDMEISHPSSDPKAWAVSFRFAIADTEGTEWGPWLPYTVHTGSRGDALADAIITWTTREMNGILSRFSLPKPGRWLDADGNMTDVDPAGILAPVVDAPPADIPADPAPVVPVNAPAPVVDVPVGSLSGDTWDAPGSDAVRILSVLAPSGEMVAQYGKVGARIRQIASNESDAPGCRAAIMLAFGIEEMPDVYVSLGRVRKSKARPVTLTVDYARNSRDMHTVRVDMGEDTGDAALIAHRAFRAFAVMCANGTIAKMLRTDGPGEKLTSPTLRKRHQEQAREVMADTLAAWGESPVARRVMDATEAARKALVSTERKRRTARKAATPETPPADAPAAPKATSPRKTPAAKSTPRKSTARKGAVKSTVPTSEVCASTGLTFAEMREATGRHYANGQPLAKEMQELAAHEAARESAPTRKRTRKNAAPVSKGDADAVVYVKCEVKRAHRVPPVPGSDVQEKSKSPKSLSLSGVKGQCPECRGIVDLVGTSAGNAYLDSHYVGGVNPPAGKGLKSRTIPATDHGSVPGSPAKADKRRAKEVDDLRAVENVKERARIQKKTPSKRALASAAAREVQSREKLLSPDASAKGEGLGQRGHGSVDGSAMVTSHTLPPVQVKNGNGTWALPATLSPGMDPAVRGEWCPVCNAAKRDAHRGKSPAWRRRHSKEVAKWHAVENARKENARNTDAARAERMNRIAGKSERKRVSTGRIREGVIPKSEARSEEFATLDDALAGTDCIRRTSGDGRKV